MKFTEEKLERAFTESFWQQGLSSFMIRKLDSVKI